MLSWSPPQPPASDTMLLIVPIASLPQPAHSLGACSLELCLGFLLLMQTLSPGARDSQICLLRAAASLSVRADIQLPRGYLLLDFLRSPVLCMKNTECIIFLSISTSLYTRSHGGSSHAGNLGATTDFLILQATQSPSQRDFISLLVGPLLFLTRPLKGPPKWSPASSLVLLQGGIFR